MVLPDPRSLGHMMLLLQLLEELRGSCARTHTLRYDLTLSLHGSGEPQFLALGYLDDEVFLRYDGDSHRAQPWGLGTKGHAGAETWARETEDLRVKEQQLRSLLTEVVKHQRQDGGLHTLQATLGCELQGNLSTGGFWRLGYNGQGFLTFDPKNLAWTMGVPSAQSTRTVWEKHVPRADLVKTFLNDTCPTRLQRHLASSMVHLVYTGPPRVTVTRRKFPVGRITLTCRAFNLYPPAATLTWLWDGKPRRQHTVGPQAILPSGDGTYQTWESMWVLPGEDSRVTCQVQHGSYNTTVPAVFEHQTTKTAGPMSPAAPLTVSALPVVMVWVVWI